MCAVPGLRAWAMLAYAIAFIPATAFTLAAWNRDDRFTRMAIVIFALAVRVPLAVSQPLWSNDAYRYVWDGRLAERGIDPRAVAPIDPALKAEQSSPLWAHIDWRSIPTVYPPLAIALFEATARVDPNGVSGAKILSLAGDLGTVFVLFAGLGRLRLPRGRAALYALHPLVLVSFAQDAHVESIAIAGSCLAIAGHRLTRAPAFAVAVLTKLYPLIFAPLVFADDLLSAGAAFAIVLVAYVPALVRGHPFGSLGNFLGSQQFNDTFFVALGATGSAIVLFGVVAGATFAVQRGAELAVCALVVTVAYLLTTPNALPWYVAIVPPLIVFVREPFARPQRAFTAALLWWSATAALSFGAPWWFPGGSVSDIGVRVVEYGPLLAVGLAFIRPQLRTLGVGLTR